MKTILLLFIIVVAIHAPHVVAGCLAAIFIALALLYLAIGAIGNIAR